MAPVHTKNRSFAPHLVHCFTPFSRRGRAPLPPTLLPCSRRHTENPHSSLMEALDMLLTRRSVKRFAPDSLPSVADLQRIADAGANAPTGRGRQSPFIVVVTDRAVRDELSRLNAEILGRDGDPFYGAPVVMVVLADRAQPTYLYDGSLVMGNLLNAAHALGWGACWIHRAHEMFDRPEGKALLAQWGIDADVEGIGLCVVGHAEHFPSHTPPRKEGYIRFV